MSRPASPLTPNTVAIARLLLKGPTWGYAAHQDTGLSTSAAYLVLERLKTWGWAIVTIQTGDGPPRRVYTLTRLGRRRVAESLRLTVEYTR